MTVVIQTFVWDSNYNVDTKTVSLSVNLIIALMQKVLSSVTPPFCNITKTTFFINNFNTMFRFNLSHDQKSVTMSTSTHNYYTP